MDGRSFEALDNGVRSCDKPKALQKICDGLDAAEIDRLPRKWLARRPHLFSRQDRAGGCRYALSILQAEFSLTQVLDPPVSGHVCLRIDSARVCRKDFEYPRPPRSLTECSAGLEFRTSK